MQDAQSKYVNSKIRVLKLIAVTLIRQQASTAIGFRLQSNPFNIHVLSQSLQSTRNFFAYVIFRIFTFQTLPLYFLAQSDCSYLILVLQTHYYYHSVSLWEKLQSAAPCVPLKLYTSHSTIKAVS